MYLNLCGSQARQPKGTAALGKKLTDEEKLFCTSETLGVKRYRITCICGKRYVDVAFYSVVESWRDHRTECQEIGLLP